MRHFDTTTFRAVAVVLCSSFAIWACSAAEPSTSGGSSKESDSKSNDGKTPKTTTGSSSGTSGSTTNPPAQTTNPTDPAPTAGQCTAAQGEDACTDCCEGKNPKGAAAEEPLDDAWTTCVCAAAACATACAQSACGPNEDEPVDGDACSTCIENLPCDDQWETACEANADCAALQTCEEPCSPEDNDLKAGARGNAPDAQMKQLKQLNAAKHAKARAAAKHQGILERHRQVKVAAKNVTR